MATQRARGTVAAEPETAGTQVQDAVARVLRWASRGDVRRTLAGAAARDLSPTDAWLLAAITDNGPVRVSDLAEWQGVDKSTITPQVRRLEDRRLVSRRPDPADGRAVLLSATPRGRQIRNDVAAAGAAVFDAILRDWASADRQALGALLSRFAEQLAQEPLSRVRTPDRR